MRDDNRTQKENQIKELAGEALQLSRDGILMHMRFFDVALSKLQVKCLENTGAHLFDGTCLYYDPEKLLSGYKREKNYVSRLYLHTLLHCIFYHSRVDGKLDRELWNLATDIAVENTILEMHLPTVKMSTDDELAGLLALLCKMTKGLTAEKIYRHFRIEDPSSRARAQWIRLCRYDEHIYWDKQEELNLSQKQWRKISERIKADLKSFSKDKNSGESMEQNLREATKERYSYTDFLRKFMVMGETMQINDDEFDYIYYTYGLATYGNMPLVEPLEYKDSKKIKDFVIAIDTSASCRGEIVQSFLDKTYQIMQQKENFFSKINVHILQCDSALQKDTKITSKEEFDAFIKNEKLTGFGSTDFRPVFEYVDSLRENGEFDDLKGLLYFTDGYGIYPETMPAYDVAFVFLEDDENIPQVPSWAIKIVLEQEEFEA